MENLGELIIRRNTVNMDMAKKLKGILVADRVSPVLAEAFLKTYTAWCRQKDVDKIDYSST